MSLCSAPEATEPLPDLLTILAEATPCDDCPYRMKCADHHLACIAFAGYVDEMEWRGIERRPARWTYERVFAQEDGVRVPVPLVPPIVEPIRNRWS